MAGLRFRASMYLCSMSSVTFASLIGVAGLVALWGEVVRCTLVLVRTLQRELWIADRMQLVEPAALVERVVLGALAVPPAVSSCSAACVAGLPCLPQSHAAAPRSVRQADSRPLWLPYRAGQCRHSDPR